MPKPAKDEKYLKDLEDARCEDRWDAVPELVRKVRKHATGRECLAVTAETEYAISKAQPKQKSESRPTTAVSAKDVEVENLLPKLLSAIEGENSRPEDKFQAQVCVGWLSWVVGDYNTAADRLPNIEEEYAQLETAGAEGVSEWTRVCTLRAAYLKACCLNKNNDRLGALAVFESALPTCSNVWTGHTGRAQLQFWAELFLTEFCMEQAQALERGEKTLEESNSLSAFRAWAKYFETSRPQGTPLMGGRGFIGAVPRRRVWNKYFTAVSGILEQDLPYPTATTNDAGNGTSARTQLRMELKRAETAYEQLLLSETLYPRADEEREEVEVFVSVIMRNWNILHGRDWHESDLGTGGKEGLSHAVLDILYRAATKTFHSTAILRHLFTVHLAVAEFDLAFKAFDAYVDIVRKGKARVDKTGHPEPNLDSDATVLETMSTAITALCKHGFYEAAERARDLGVELEGMLEHLPAPLPKSEDNITTLDEEDDNGAVLHPRLTAGVNALAWWAIGLSQAQWSRQTYSATARTDFQLKAIQSFQRSLSPETGNPSDIRALFTLGLLLAERRELAAAIEIVKAALMSNKITGEQNLSAGSYWRERSLIPLWHLLALLLSARQDYVMAARACEGAFEQFDDPAVLFGSQSLPSGFRSEHLNEAETTNGDTSKRGLVDEMDDLEKEGIIDVKMTQLALVELLESPEVAVNASHELLVLYTRLFGSLKPEAPAPIQRSATAKSASGTMRSIRGSIFGSKSLKHAATTGTDTTNAGAVDVPERPKTAQTTMSDSTAAPTIQVTRDNGKLKESRSRRSSGSARGRSASAKRQSSLKKLENGSRQRSMSSGSGLAQRPAISDGDAYFSPGGDGAANDRPDYSANKRGSVSSQRSFSKGKGLTRFDSTASRDPADMNIGPLSPLNPLPLIQFPKDQVKRQRQAILVKVWLMIAAFYRRAEIYRECRGALEEARKLVDSMEADLAKDTEGSVKTSDAGWGAKKCFDELWADVLAEIGHLLVAEGEPIKARAEFEEALMHYQNHPSAIVGLSNILLDVYNETLLPPPAIPGLTLPDGEQTALDALHPDDDYPTPRSKAGRGGRGLPSTPLGLGGATFDCTEPEARRKSVSRGKNGEEKHALEEELPAPHKAMSLPLVDRLTARDRAYGLLSGLTKLGTGWNYTDAWFALARAHEEGGQPDKAKEALWWCVELEEGLGVREWTCVGAGGYVL